MPWQDLLGVVEDRLVGLDIAGYNMSVDTHRDIVAVGIDIGKLVVQL